MRKHLPIMLLVCATAAACTSQELIEQFLCATENAGASVDVTGTYDYRGNIPHLLLGSITLRQTGATVDVTETTYTNSTANRPLIGTGTLVGNTLDITLVPENGDLDYEAYVTFRFADGGDTFCVAFDDTNADMGGMGSFTGTRRP